MGDDNKIYVGGLATETTSESLRAHFSKFGEITDCIVMPDKVTGRSRCFGFITFKDTGSMNAALGTANLVDGREVACKKAVREGPAQSQCEGPYNVLKIFVGGLPASCDYDKFTSYFGRFGQIEDAVVMMDSQTQRHRGFGYVTYSESSAVEAALQSYAANQIDGKWVEVKRCIPQDRMSPGQSFKGKGKAAVPKTAPSDALPRAGLMGAAAAPPAMAPAQPCGCAYGAAYAPYGAPPVHGSREAGPPADLYAGYGCGPCYAAPGYPPGYASYCGAAYAYAASAYSAPQPRYPAYRPAPY